MPSECHLSAIRVPSECHLSAISFAWAPKVQASHSQLPSRLIHSSHPRLIRSSHSGGDASIIHSSTPLFSHSQVHVSEAALARARAIERMDLIVKHDAHNKEQAAAGKPHADPIPQRLISPSSYS